MALVGLGTMADNTLGGMPRINGLGLAVVVEPRNDPWQAIATTYRVQAFNDYDRMRSGARDKIDLVLPRCWILPEPPLHNCVEPA